jgi:hypothetical protein
MADPSLGRAVPFPDRERAQQRGVRNDQWRAIRGGVHYTLG